MCKHNKLVDEGLDAMQTFSLKNSVDKTDFTPEYIMYKKYKCEDCGRAVIVLHAVVEQGDGNG